MGVLTGKGRRTIMGGDAPSYRGPQQIEGYYNAAHQDIIRKVRGVTKVQPCPYPEDSQRTFLTLWGTGCREGEAIMLKPTDFKWDAKGFGSPKLPVLKKREKVRDSEGNIIYKEVITKVRQQNGSIQDQVIYRPESKRKLVYREHLIPRDTPLIEELIQIIENLQDQGYKYLLYRMLPFSRTPVPNQSCSETIVQDRVTELHPDLFPHGIRALHARYLRARYGKEKFDTPQLKDHFKWSSTEMAVYYLSGQDLADIMDISVPW